MSEKKQHTAASMRDKMLSRYGDGLHHKHDKLHLDYRKHFRTHPNQPNHFINEDKEINESTGQIREFKLRKIRKRLDKGRFH
jgi:hypothetical protein